MAQEYLYLFIADISGYTSFMIKNQMERDHGTLIITELMNCLIKEIDLPMEIAKLEGDAIFFILHGDHKNSPFLVPKLLLLFDLFSNKIKEMMSTAVCKCGGCINIDQLNLKVIIHYGKALVTQIGSFKELSGVDVILVHRLLKNHVPSKHYLLMTQAAYDHLEWPADKKLDKSEESDPDLGALPTYVYPLDSVTQPIGKRELTLPENLKGHFKLLLGSLMLKLHLKKRPSFHNFPTSK